MRRRRRSSWSHDLPKRSGYSLTTLTIHGNKLREGDYPSREPALAPVVDLPVLEITPAVAEIVAADVQHRLMPADPAGDALHLAWRRTTNASSW